MGRLCDVRTDGFYGRFYPVNSPVKSVIIAVTDDDVKDTISRSMGKWLCSLGVSALAVSPEKEQKGCHSYPLERIERAVEFLKQRGYTKIGIWGISASAMCAMTAASLLRDITLTIALTPSDYVMEGYYQDKKDGTAERPGDYEASLTWRGQPLPFLPYAYRHPEYWHQIQKEAKRRKDIIAGRDMFEESERRHPLQEEEMVKVEQIRGHIYMAGAEDDVMWNTCKYIRRMEKRMEERPHTCTLETHIYEHGTHFVFPEGLARIILPVRIDLVLPLVFREAKGYTKECRRTRTEIERTLVEAIRKWEHPSDAL